MTSLGSIHPDSSTAPDVAALGLCRLFQEVDCRDETDFGWLNSLLATPSYVGPMTAPLAESPSVTALGNLPPLTLVPRNVTSYFDKLMAGYFGSLRVGYFDNLMAGYFGSLRVGYFDNLMAGHFDDLTLGYFDNLTAGYFDNLKSIADGMVSALSAQPAIEKPLWPFRGRLLEALDAEPVQDGYSHPAEGVLEDALAYSIEDAAQWIRLLITEDSEFTAPVLKCLARIDSPVNERWRADLVREALAKPEVEVRDAAIQAIELWEDEEALRVLQAHTETVPWLCDYIEQVIRDFSA